MKETANAKKNIPDVLWHGGKALLPGTVILLKQLDTDIPASGLEGGDAG